MTGKGNSEFCCCTGCDQRPLLWDSTGALTLLETVSWRRFCCACVPIYACVTILNNLDEIGTGNFKLYCSEISDLGLDQPLYRQINYVEGEGILVGTEVIDVTFHFFVVDNECLFAIRSTALTIDENTTGATVVIDSLAREAPNSFCRTLGMDELGYTEFTVGDYRFRIQKADHIPIRGRENCISGSTIVIDDDPIKNLCCNCNCICNCMCLTISSPGLILDEEGQATGSSSAQTACMYNNGWTFPNGVRVELRPLAQISTEHLITCWDLDETSGTRLDSFGNNHLTDNVGVGYATGKLSNAASFTGLGYLSKADTNSLRLADVNASIVGWVNFTSLSADMTIMSKNEGNSVTGFGWKIWLDSSEKRIKFSVGNGTSIFDVTGDSGGDIVTSAWYFFAAVIDNDNLEIQLSINNGTVTATTFTDYVAITDSYMFMGRNGGSASPEFLNGLVDQVSIWSTNLTSDMLSVIYNNGLGVSCDIDDRCYLHLTDTGPFDIASLPSPVLLDATENPCPRPTAEWEMTEGPTDSNPFTHSVFFSLRCVTCEDSCSIERSSCCASGRSVFPSVLSADVTTGCPDCPSFGVSLVWKFSEQLWVGHGNMCGHDITLKIGCPFTSLLLTATPCTGGTDTDTGATCEPILGSFSFSSGGIGCCGGSSTINPTIGITVYE